MEMMINHCTTKKREEGRGLKEKIGMGAVKAPVLLLSAERQFILDIIVVFGVEIFAGDKPDVRIGRFVHENVEERGDFSVVVADGFGIVLGVGEIDSQPCRKFVVIRDGLSQNTLKVMQCAVLGFEHLLHNTHAPGKCLVIAVFHGVVDKTVDVGVQSVGDDLSEQVGQFKQGVDVVGVMQTVVG